MCTHNVTVLIVPTCGSVNGACRQLNQRGRPSFLFHGSRQIHLGHAICEDFRLGVIEIGQNDHREFVIRDLCFEALPRSFVFDDPVTVLGDDKPAKKARSLLGSRQIRHLIEHELGAIRLIAFSTLLGQDGFPVRPP
jgi:hypothetical protein